MRDRRKPSWTTFWITCKISRRVGITENHHSGAMGFWRFFCNNYSCRVAPKGDAQRHHVDPFWTYARWDIIYIYIDLIYISVVYIIPSWNCPSSSVRPGAIECVDGASDSELLPVFIHVMMFFLYRAGRLQSITCCCIVFKDVLHALMKRGLKIWNSQHESPHIATLKAAMWNSESYIVGSIWSYLSYLILSICGFGEGNKKLTGWTTCSCRVFGMVFNGAWCLLFFGGAVGWCFKNQCGLGKVFLWSSMFERWDHE